MTKTHDIVIIGGGPAGLQAALSGGRVHRGIVLLDDGHYRNAPAAHMHNVLGHDGTAPGDLRRRVRTELSNYPTVQVRSERATSIADDGEGGFDVHLANGEVLQTGAVVLATGVRDELPELPGLSDIWGDRAAHCPFCHGHEFAGGRYGMLGAPMFGHMSGMLAPMAGSITGVPVAADAEQEVPSDIAGVTIASGHAVGVQRTGDGIAVAMSDGSSVALDVLFVTPTLHQRAPLAADLGLELNPSGCVRVDEFGRTSKPGIFAAGDMAHIAAYPMPMASVVGSMNSGQMALSGAVMHLLTSAKSSQGDAAA